MKENENLKSKIQNLLSRPPVVVVMGHIDHGKTTLLDYIRKSNVAGREAGGITQSIGAYEIEYNKKKITFIDTPGHEAFSKMRARGSQVADLAILVVAADEGVKPQTKEVLAHIQAAKLPFVVAINKVDKPDINLDRIKNELMTAGILLEGYGGDVSYQTISAKTGQGIPELLDLILLAAEMESLKYDSQALAQGIIIEAHMDSRRGIIASVIIKNGILKIGQEIATPTSRGKIKSLENFLGARVKSLEPSSPALISGFNALPQVGEEFLTGEMIKIKEVVNIQKINPVKNLSISNGVKLILKASNAGELEALNDMVLARGFEVLSRGVGEINETDWKSALNSGALLIGFRVGLDQTAENLSRVFPAETILSNIIYELMEKIEERLTQDSGLNVIAELEVLAVFGKPEKGRQIIGGRVTKGIIKNKQTFSHGRILNIQEQREDITEAAVGKEIGLLVESDDIIKVGDILKFNELPKSEGS